jgi:CRP-like cAMP-binding protein
VALYIVKSGTLKAYKERSDGEKFLGEIQSNELAGEMAIFDPEFPYKRVASVSAVTDALLLVILKEAIMQLSTKHPEIFEKITKIIKKRRNTSL